MIDFHRRSASYPDADEVLNALTARAAAKAEADGALNEAVRAAIVQRLIRLASSTNATPALLSRAERTLHEIALRLPADRSGGFWKRRIERFLDREFDPERPTSLAGEAPPGSPIGMPPQLLSGCSQDG
jgi:hypothetical protein